MPIFKLQPEWMLNNTPKTKDTQVGNGIQGNLDTLEIMTRVARERSRHPLIRELALKILLTHQVQSQNYKDEALAIARFVKDKVRYVRDIDHVETLIDPLTLVDQIMRGEAQGDCDDMSMLTASLLLSIGHRPNWRIVKYNDEPFSSFQHVYVVDYDKNFGGKKERIVLDCIIKHKPIGYEIAHVKGKEFRI